MSDNYAADLAAEIERDLANAARSAYRLKVIIDGDPSLSDHRLEVVCLCKATRHLDGRAAQLRKDLE